MMYSTKIPYEITSHRYENADFILTSDHICDRYTVNVLNDNDLFVHGYSADITFIYEFKIPIIPKQIYCNIASNNKNNYQKLEIYYWDDINFQYILFKRTFIENAPMGKINKVNEIFDTDIKTTKIKIMVGASQWFDVYLCTLDYEAESKTVKSLVSSAITENELFQQLTVPSSIE